MGFNWGGLVGNLTGGLYSPGKKEKMPKLGTEKKQYKITVGKGAQAGGAKIQYNTEGWSDEDPNAKKDINIINPAFNNTKGTATTPKKSPFKYAPDTGGGEADGAAAPNFYTSADRSPFRAAPSDEGQRSEAAKRLQSPWKYAP